jgi:hypothetical protein
MPNPEKRSWKAKLLAEFENLLAIVAYLFVLFAVFQLHTAMILVSRGINYSYSQGIIFALVNALVLGKFMLIAEALHAGKEWQSRALLYSTLFRSVGMAVILVICHLLEEGLVAIWHGRSFFAAPDMNFIEILSLGLVMFVVLIPFFAFRELQRVLGKAELKSLFLQHKIANGSVNAR